MGLLWLSVSIGKLFKFQGGPTNWSFKTMGSIIIVNKFILKELNKQIKFLIRCLSNSQAWIILKYIQFILKELNILEN